jgi:O-antigen/teichoic acid export membrane protein
LSVPAELIAKHQLGLGLMLLMAMWFTFGSASGIVVRIMIPAGMLYQSQWLGIGMRLIQFVSIVFVAVCGGSILAACFWYAVIQSLGSLFVLWYLRSRLPQFYPWWRGGQWKYGILTLQKSLVLTCNSIGGQLSNNGLLILISALFTSAVIPSFTTLRTLTNAAGTVTTILISALLPDLIRFHATREKEKLISVLNVNWFIGGICVNFGIILALPLVEPVYRFWTKGYLTFNPSLFFLLAVAISLTNFGAGLSLYLAGINDLRSQTAITLTRTGILFLVAYLLSGLCGILSIGIGAVSAELVASVALPILFANRRLAELSAHLCHRQLVLAIMPPLLLLAAGTVVSVYHQRMGLVTVVILPVLCGLYYMNWKELSLDIRQRITILVTSTVRKFSFGD